MKPELELERGAVSRSLELNNAYGAWIWDAAAGRLFADARFAALCGLDAAEALTGLPTADFAKSVVPDDRLRVRIALAGIAYGAEVFQRDYRVRGIDGLVRWVSAHGRAERDPDGGLLRFTGILSDVTERKHVEEQLRVAQTAGGVGTFEHTDGFGTASVSEQFCRLLGLQTTDALPVRTINACVLEGDAPIVQSGVGQGSPADFAELRICRADTGEERWLARRGEHRTDGAGGGRRFIGVIYDITDTKSAEAELRALAQTLEERVADRTRERDQLWNTARDLFFVTAPSRSYVAVNPAWTHVLGHEPHTLLSNRNANLIHPDDLGAFEGVNERLARGEAVRDLDARIRTADGAYRWINWTIIPEGEFLYGAGRDVSERKQLEEQLRQSQKMEAVGQLTGGLAHDFNNMLTGIMGGLDLAARRIAQGRPDEAARFMESAKTAAERAAALTHRLLAFSRRQSLASETVQVNALLQSTEDFLRRSLGEQIDVRLDLAPDLWPIRSDPNQLESAVLNLAINARDAMPKGGRLTIATSNVSLAQALPLPGEDVAAGDYVAVRVADTGAGMSSAVLAKVFDPFFTTKPIGQGTGLGLSMVYGFLHQTGGRVAIESEIDRGTTVTLYFQREVAETGEDEATKTAGAPPRGAGENVLLVEDDPQVRVLVRTVLEELGYEPIEATDAASALDILDGGPPIHLLVSDVGLPGMDGRRLAAAARARRAELPVLLMTGYAPDAIEQSKFLGEGMRMIAKPFALDQLASVLREMLTG